ncbi:unnamed protein product [Ilex paraguariensis]|uniref:Uncharacterized protein n=1 Tax=Ilex paraguariensis TaxID=185542 RepID=A0ABC8RJ20_9AQUA
MTSRKSFGPQGRKKGRERPPLRGDSGDEPKKPQGPEFRKWQRAIYESTIAERRRFFEALLPNIALPVVSPPVSTSRPTNSRAVELATSTPPPAFVSDPRGMVQEIDNSEEEEEEEFEFE